MHLDRAALAAAAAAVACTAAQHQQGHHTGPPALGAAADLMEASDGLAAVLKRLQPLGELCV